MNTVFEIINKKFLFSNQIIGSTGNNIITWYNVSSGRIIFAGPVNVVGDERLSIDGSKGRRLRLADITEFDSGVYRCQVEVRTRPIALQHTLNVLGKLQSCTVWSIWSDSWVG